MSSVSSVPSPFFDYLDTHYITLFTEDIYTKTHSLENELELTSYTLLPSMNWASQFNLYKDVNINFTDELLYIQNQYNILRLRYKIPDFIVSHHFLRLIYKFTSKILVLPCLRTLWTINTNVNLLKNNVFFVEMSLIKEDNPRLQLNIKLNKTLFDDHSKKSIILDNAYIRKFILEMNQSVQLSKYNSIIQSLESKVANTNTTTIPNQSELCSILHKKLYNYQIENIKWMENIENKVRQNQNIIDYSYSLHETLPELHSYIVKDKFYPIDDNNTHIINYDNQLQYFGGCLIDEMGLGKTLCMLTLIYKDKQKHPHFNINKTLCHYKFKKGKHASTFCSNNIKNNTSNFYCKLHEKSLTEVRRVEYKKHSQDLIELLPSKNRFVSNASVIICPSHLCEHWIREANELFKHTWNIILISTFEQLKQLNAVDICFAELIIVSQNLLVNTKYRQLCKNQQDINLQDYKYTTLKCPNLSLFRFKRLVFDESHELFKGNITLLSSISNLSSTFRWLLSGTPFPHELDSLVHNLILTTDSELSLYQNNYSFTKLKKQGFFDQNFINELFSLYRKNTKESVKHEIKDNTITQTTKWLEFTNAERSIYDSYSFGKSQAINFLLQLCCHPELYSQTKKLVKNCKSLSEIQETLLNYYQTKIDTFQTHLKILQTTHSELQIKINESTEEDSKKELEQSLTSTIKSIKKIENEIQSYNRTRVYLSSIINTTHLKNFTCPICLESNTQDNTNLTNLSITICGHTFCSDCLDTHFVEKNFCPQCRCKLSDSDCFVIKQQNHLTENFLTEDLENLNEIVEDVKSTKIGNIIHFVKHHILNFKQDKIIIFSQWESLLTKVQEYLSDYNIKSAFCKGSIYQKNKVIRNFKSSEDMPILLLSSNLAASGLDLICANKVIFIEPIYGSKKYKKDIESQAIGRVDRIGQDKSIEIIRFFIKDTIEEKIYENDFEIFN